jgi:hypothetical protein
MKSILLSMLLLASVHVLQAQTDPQPSPLLGKWKITFVDAGVTHDYKTGKTTYPDDFLKKMKGNKDSTMMVGLMGVMVGNFDNFYYVFTADGKYQEIRESKVKQEGTYKLNEEKSIIETTCMSRLGTPVKQEMIYKFKDGKLCLSVPQRDKKIEIVTEKVIQ